MRICDWSSDVCSSDRSISGIKMALEIALVDASDLVGEGRHRGALVIKASQVQEYDGDVASRFADRVFRRGLGFGIGPAGRDWTILLNAFAGSAGLMDQHRSRIDELDRKSTRLNSSH